MVGRRLERIHSVELATPAKAVKSPQIPRRPCGRDPGKQTAENNIIYRGLEMLERKGIGDKKGRAQGLSAEAECNCFWL